MPTQEPDRTGFRCPGAIAAVVMSASSMWAQSTSPRPTFEVATIKPSVALDFEHCADAPPSPGKLSVRCNTLANLIQQAYGVFANGTGLNTQSVPISGGPDWIAFDHFDINAKADGNPPLELMMGPMLQALLEDRFHLKLHRETREVPVYALTVAKGGLKVKPVEDGSCTPLDFAKIMAPPTAGQPPANLCGTTRFGRNGAVLTVNMHAMSMTEFCRNLSGGPTGSGLDRPVADKTGINGMFDFHLEFAPDQTTPGFLMQLRVGGRGAPATSDDPAGPSIFTAVQEQLGLKLDPAKGPGEFLVIDHVEKPSEN